MLLKQTFTWHLLNKSRTREDFERNEAAVDFAFSRPQAHLIHTSSFQMEQRRVPHFASFKPRTTASASAQSEQTPKIPEKETRPDRRSRKDQEERRTSSHRHRHSSRERQHYRDHRDERRRKDREREPHHERHHRESRQPKSHALVQDELEESEYYLIDRRGDAKNVEFGGLHRYSIPSYHRIGYGYVLGAESHAKIDREASTEKAIVLRCDRGQSGGRAERLLAKKHFKAGGKTQRLILPNDVSGDADAPMDLEQDFLALRSNLKRKRRSESPDGNGPDLHYRSVEGKAKLDLRPQDDDAELDTSADEARNDDPSDRAVRLRNTELSRAAKTDPTNADAWLALIEHQARSIFPDGDTDDLTTSQRRSVAEIRLSILDQAFRHITNQCPGHDRLLLTYIMEGSKVWDNSKLERKWDETLKGSPSSLILWQEYLSYIQTGHAPFRYETCKDAHLKCLDALKESNSSACPGDKPSIANALTYMLLRLTRFTCDSGYEELAIAIWQAVLEYCLFAPESLTTAAEKLAAFEEFWESDSPRIGEAGAAGWRDTATATTSTSRQTQSHSPQALSAQTPFARFATTENSMARDFWLPAATDDEESSDDPFRYVMFSDVTPILERLPEQLDSKLLIDALLCFLGLPALLSIGPASHAAREWASDPFLQDFGIESTKPTTQLNDSFSLLYDGFKGLPLNSEASKFMHRALSTLVTALPEYEELGEYKLAFLYRTDPSEARKAAKRLLKTRFTSLRYYNAYALGEATLAESADQLDKAKNIWTKALELSQSFSGDARDDAVLLWHSWIMTLVHNSAEGEALRVLLTVPDGTGTAILSAGDDISAAAALKTRRHIEDSLDHMNLKHRPVPAALYADLLLWLAYLTSTPNINPALSTFAKTASKLQKEALELHHQAKARLLGHHIHAKRPFKPTLLRDELESSRRLFPENSAILTQLHQVTKSTRLDDRLRNALGEASTTSAHGGLVSWSHLLDAEIARTTVEGASATANSVRALFRRALLSSDSKVRASPLLWKKWMDFEREKILRACNGVQQRGEDAVKRTKEVFLSGLRCLPWHKGWIVTGMATFAEAGVMDEEDLRRIHDVLVEREMRVRLDVDRDAVG